MSVKPIPEGYHTVTPYFTVDHAKQLIDFLTEAFNAQVCEISEADGVVFNAEIKIGNSMIMVADTRGRFPAGKSMMYLYVDNVDDVYARAVEAGGKPVMAPTDQFYGDRSGGVEDPCGNQWWVATHTKDVSPEEIARHAQQIKG